MDWDDARVLLAVGKAQTLRGAARELRIDQATVGRRLANLEQALSSVLFLRTSTGYVLTPAGEAATAAAQRMEEAALDLVRRTQGLDADLSGQVRITTTEWLAVDFIIPAVAVLNLRHPGIDVVVHGTSQIANISKREADIAVRTLKPDSPELIVRRLAEWPMTLFASDEYLARKGTPVFGDCFRGHDIVMYEPYLEATPNPTLSGDAITHARVALAANSSLIVRQALKAGIGLGEIPTNMGERDGLVRVWPERARAKPYEVWMVTHTDLRHTARIRAVIDHLVETFAATGNAEH